MFTIPKPYTKWNKFGDSCLNLQMNCIIELNAMQFIAGILGVERCTLFILCSLLLLGFFLEFIVFL